MNRSTVSKASNASSKMLEELASRSQAKIFKSQGSFNDEQMRVIWNSLGLYVSRNLRMGRGVNVPKLGLFTFTPPEVRLKGVTNEQERDQRPRNPVFLLQKQFVKGKTFKTAIFYHQQFGMGLRPYTAFGSTGDVPITKMNIMEISSYANMSKDATQIALNRIIKYLAEKLSLGNNLNFQIPNVGALISRGNLVAVRFNEFLNRDTRTILSKSVDERKQRGMMNLTSDNLKRLNNLSNMSTKLANKSSDFFEIDDSARKYLNEGLGLHINNNSDALMKRSMTGFDRIVASKPFDNVNVNNELKNSQFMRMSASSSNGFGIRGHKGLLSSRNANQTFDLNPMATTVNGFNRQYNMPLRIVKEWVFEQCDNSKSSFKDFCKISGTKKDGVLLAEDVWQACKQISSDITEQQSHELFRLLDFNKDGYVTEDDWIKNIDFDSNKNLKALISVIKKKKYTLTALMKVMGIEGMKKVSVHQLKESIKKVSPNFPDFEALSLSRYICKGKSDVDTEILLEILNVPNLGSEDNQQHQNHKNNNNISVDQQWQQKFLKRIAKKLIDNGIYNEQLVNKFRFFDQRNTHFIDQNDFKSVLSEIGIGLTLTELIKIVKVFPINEHNQIHYHEFVSRISDVRDEMDYGQQQTNGQNESNDKISEESFNNKLKKLIEEEDLPCTIPTSVSNMVSALQSTPTFNAYSESSLKPWVKKIDLNKDNRITNEDLKAFQQKTLNKRQLEAMPEQKVYDLFLKLKERSIRKKISYLDVFRQIDSNGNGFITREEWHNNLGSIISFNETQRENMFNLMNRKGLEMIDEKTFLTFINLQSTTGESFVKSKNDYEKFGWVEGILSKIKQWYSKANLTLEDSFRIVDKDGDTYINDKDLIAFVTDRLKVNSREISLVRVQKLIKVLDTYKKGKLNFVDWKTFITGKRLSDDQNDNNNNSNSSPANNNPNWVSEAKQQIGIVLSRKYSNLEQAFNDITQGDRKLLFNAFQKWIKDKKVLSGFMVNDDILKHLYSSLDEHKKGYILENDFISVFSQYNWKVEHVKEFIHEMTTKFKTCQQAYQYLANYKKSGTSSNSKLKEEQFYQSAQKIFGNRFTKVDLKNIWSNIASGQSEIKREEFERKYGCEWNSKDDPIEKNFPKDSWVYKDFSIIKGTQTRGEEFAYSETEKMEIQANKIIQNVKEMLHTSPKTLEQAFREVDKTNSGKVTNLQFKKAFRILNIALTSKEIDLLLNYCNFKLETIIDWRAFIRMLNLREQKKAIFDRLQPKIQHLSDLMHFYMVSPKDAFKKWNNPRSGYMVFQEFYKMAEKLFNQAQEPLPEFQQIKQMFNYIDVRKDDHIDLQEFTQIFRNCKPPSLLMGTTPANQQQLIAKHSSPKDADKPIRDQSVPIFKNSPVYEEFVNMVGRNRKYLQAEIEKQSSEPLVAFEIVVKIIKEFAGSQKLSLEESLIRNLLAFSMTGEKVDYRLMFSDLKQRSEMNVEHPKRNFF